MRHQLSKRQKAYREYLQTDHWKALRAMAIQRDGAKCVDCGSDEFLQVHHKFYRTPFEASQPDDLETKCRTCHRIEHGFGPDLFDMKLRQLSRMGRIPTREEEKELISLIRYEEEVDEVLGFLRHNGCMRIIYTNVKRWDSWLKKPKEIRFRMWPWARRKFDRIEAEIDLETVEQKEAA